jgi:hypothetical protein
VYPKVSIRMVLRGGAACDPTTNFAVPEFVTHVIARRDAIRFLDDFKQLPLLLPSPAQAEASGTGSARASPTSSCPMASMARSIEDRRGAEGIPIVL